MMSPGAQHPLQAYRHAAVDASVAVASPHELVVLLFEGARAALAQARGAFARNDAASRAQSLAKAVAILEDGLRASLDLGKGGALADQLDALYEYMALRLVLCNADGDPSKVDEVDRLLASIGDAWRQIGGSKA